MMDLLIDHLRQIAISVDDIDAAEEFYSETLNLRKLFRVNDLLFYDCRGVRLFISKGGNSKTTIYFQVPDLTVYRKMLQDKGISFKDEIHCIAQMPDHDLLMCFFMDPWENVIGLMQEAPKGFWKKAREQPI